MKKLIIICVAFMCWNLSNAQENSNQTSKIGWFINPEIGGIFHNDHFGRTLGGTLGVKLFKKRLKVGAQWYGRPGPINSMEYTVTPSDGQIYKGRNEITLRADHGTFGLFLAPIINLKKVRIEIPMSIGSMGGGFYLLGDDRLTPDGDRVSVWEDRLMDGRDAGFSTFYEIGTRLFIPMPNEHISLGLGLHYTLAPDWETYTDPTGDLYNNRFRIAVILGFEG
jgi:hypothetical protein